MGNQDTANVRTDENVGDEFEGIELSEEETAELERIPEGEEDLPFGDGTEKPKKGKGGKPKLSAEEQAAIDAQKAADKAQKEAEKAKKEAEAKAEREAEKIKKANTPTVGETVFGRGGVHTEDVQALAKPADLAKNEAGIARVGATFSSMLRNNIANIDAENMGFEDALTGIKQIDGLGEASALVRAKLCYAAKIAAGKKAAEARANDKESTLTAQKVLDLASGGYSVVRKDADGKPIFDEKGKIQYDHVSGLGISSRSIWEQAQVWETFFVNPQWANEDGSVMGEDFFMSASSVLGFSVFGIALQYKENPGKVIALCLDKQLTTGKCTAATARQIIAELKGDTGKGKAPATTEGSGGTPTPTQHQKAASTAPPKGHRFMPGSLVGDLPEFMNLLQAASEEAFQAASTGAEGLVYVWCDLKTGAWVKGSKKPTTEKGTYMNVLMIHASRGVEMDVITAPGETLAIDEE